MRRTATVIVVLLASIFLVPKASPHRLDELLQAVRIRLFVDRIELAAYLTPGISVAQPLFSRADKDGDGVISSTEAKDFADGWLAAVSVKVDGLPLHLRVADANIPSLRELSSGEGTIHLEFESSGQDRHAGHHQLRVENGNDAATSVYLANAVLPTTGKISIRNQSRNATQSVYVLDYDVESSAFNIATICVACLALGFGILVTRSRAPKN